MSNIEFIILAHLNLFEQILEEIFYQLDFLINWKIKSVVLLDFYFLNKYKILHIEAIQKYNLFPQFS